MATAYNLLANSGVQTLLVRCVVDILEIERKTGVDLGETKEQLMDILENLQSEEIPLRRNYEESVLANSEALKNRNWNKDNPVSADEKAMARSNILFNRRNEPD